MLERIEASSAEPVARRVFREVRNAIVTMAFQPGQALSEQEIATRLGVSRQPVREAFIKLSEAGLVTIRPQRGTFIVKISMKQVFDARFVREAVELAVVRRACVEMPSDGIAGLRNLEGADPAAVAAALSNQVHQFGGLLSVRDLTDLARFVTRGQVDMAVFIDDAERRFKGDAAAGEPFFQTICATCHGKDGRAVRTMPPLGRMVASDPWRSLHSVYNGHPGDTMPPLRAMPADIIGSILAYAQTLPAKK